MDSKITTLAQRRWLYKLMGCDFIVKYKNGSEKTVTNALSRKQEHNGAGEIYAISQLLPYWIEAIKKAVQPSRKM